MKTKTFKVTIEDKEQTILVRSPSLDDQREGQKAYNQAFTDAVKSNSVVRAKLDDLLESQGLWNDEKQAQFTLLQKQIADGEKRLQKGGFGLNEAKDLAVKIKGFRDEIRDLISVRTSLDNHSAEGQADNARFNYLVSACVVYNDTKEKVFTNLADYIDRSAENVAIEGAQILANMLYGLDNNYETNLPENKFLKKYKFVDEELRFVDKKGRLIDGEGRLINEDSRYIDEEGNFVDKYGTKLKDDGEYDLDSQPFLDEDGNPIIISEEKDEAPKTKKSKPKPKQEPLEEEPESS
tara:strand:+ start:10529 stop:11410 length:882 start_codon:yes stop_codon:yes gene_type:complete